MGVEERIRILLRAATRAEGEGETRVARIFRRRAEEVRPLDGFQEMNLRPAYGQRE